MSQKERKALAAILGGIALLVVLSITIIVVVKPKKKNNNNNKATTPPANTGPLPQKCPVLGRKTAIADCRQDPTCTWQYPKRDAKEGTCVHRKYPSPRPSCEEIVDLHQCNRDNGDYCIYENKKCLQRPEFPEYPYPPRS